MQDRRNAMTAAREERRRLLAVLKHRLLQAGLGDNIDDVLVAAAGNPDIFNELLVLLDDLERGKNANI